MPKIKLKLQIKCDVISQANIHKFSINTKAIILRSFYLISNSYFYMLKCPLNVAVFTPLKGTVYVMMILIE